MNLIRRVAHRSVHQLVRTACWLVLLALSAFAISILWPVALPVIFGMSLGHGILAVGFLLYLVSVVITMSRSQPGYEPYKPLMSKPPPHDDVSKRDSDET